MSGGCCRVSVETAPPRPRLAAAVLLWCAARTNNKARLCGLFTSIQRWPSAIAKHNYKAQSPARVSWASVSGVWRCPTFTQVSALSSALRRFTVLFGMGRRGTTSLWPPDINCHKLKEARLETFQPVEFSCINQRFIINKATQMIGSSLTSN